eukprot:TRINITY_DN4542_c0_g1_i1.p1 TRINITY_DN4542_c0_g1~~TRINITY_DN4542_c0_g1_i1.p1  ORF type:complete len:310 (-),score=29.91 TRINITY_DN4542_c0_g1_i1:34-963(-)
MKPEKKPLDIKKMCTFCGRKTKTCADVMPCFKRKLLTGIKDANRGVCLYCTTQLPSDKLLCEHLLGAPGTTPTKTTAADQDYFFIQAYSMCYWIFFKAPISANLQNLDQFLRKVWVDCCGHLSQFKLNSQNTTSTNDIQPKEIAVQNIAQPTYRSFTLTTSLTGKLPMASAVLSSVLTVGSQVEYQYDIHSTTFAWLQVVHKGPVLPVCMATTTALTPPVVVERIELVGKNIPPTIPCAILGCSEHAVMVCKICDFGKDFFCTKHADIHCNVKNIAHERFAKHRVAGTITSDNCLVKITNSPRMGCCSY